MTIYSAANSANNTWVGLTWDTPALTSTASIIVRYKIDVPCHALQLLLWNNDGVQTKLLKQSSNLQEFVVPLSLEEALNLSKISVVAWTKDNISHSINIDNIQIMAYHGNT